MNDDADLLHLYNARRDEAAFTRLVERHLGLVYFAALRRCSGDAHAAEEVAQRVFTQLAQRASQLQRHTQLTGWLYVTTRNVAANFIRDERTRRMREAEASRLNELVRDEPGSAVDWAKLQPVLDDALDALDDRDRDAILLRFLQNLAFAEIAAAFGIKEDAARMRVTRALDKLRALLMRRGFSSTSAALAFALSAQAGVAKPAGLVGSVAQAAMSGATAVTTTGTVVFGFMSMQKTAWLAAAAIALLASLGGNAYLWATARPVSSAPAMIAKQAESKPVTGAKTEPEDDIPTGDLAPLRDRLRAAGASDAVVRAALEGVLRRRYRAQLSADRRDRLARGWWRDSERTWGTAESSQRLMDDPMLLRRMVTLPLEELLGPDPADIAEADAKYSFLPPELRERFGRIDRLLPTGWSPTGEPAVDSRLRADYNMLRKTLETERDQLLAALTPEQRSSYEMRFSRTGASLAQQLEPLAVTEQEFAAVYPLATAYAADYDALARQEGGGQRAGEVDQRFAQQLVEKLGYDRALDFVWSGAIEYEAYARIAREGGLPASTAARALQLAAETANTAGDIHCDTTLTVEQKTAALAELQKTARSRLDALMPPDSQARLAPAALQWLDALGKGQYKPIASPLPGRGSVRIITGVIPVSAPSPTFRSPLLVPSRVPGG